MKKLFLIFGLLFSIGSFSQTPYQLSKSVDEISQKKNQTETELDDICFKINEYLRGNKPYNHYMPAPQNYNGKKINCPPYTLFDTIKSELKKHNTIQRIEYFAEERIFVLTIIDNHQN